MYRNTTSQSQVLYIIPVHQEDSRLRRANAQSTPRPLWTTVDEETSSATPPLRRLTTLGLLRHEADELAAVHVNKKPNQHGLGR